MFGLGRAVRILQRTPSVPSTPYGPWKADREAPRKTRVCNCGWSVFFPNRTSAGTRHLDSGFSILGRCCVER